jgi:hypothetical protein
MHFLTRISEIIRIGSLEKRIKALGVILISNILILTVFFRFVKYEDESLSLKRMASRLDANNWVFNHGVSQFSSVISGDQDKTIVIESLVFFDHLLDHKLLKENIRCYAKIDDRVMLLTPSELLSIKIVAISSFPKNIWKVKCELNKYQHKNMFLSLQVAILDRFNYENSLEWFNKSEHLVWLQKVCIILDFIVFA